MKKRSEIIKALKKPLNRKYIEVMYDGGRHHVEGWYVKAKANQIFGYDGWSMETVRLDHTPAGFMATVEVSVSFLTEGGAVRTARRSGSASEETNDKGANAAKTAETTAMKRAFASLGNQFGLPLYKGENPPAVDVTAWNEAAPDWFSEPQKQILRSYVGEVGLTNEQAREAFVEASQDRLSVAEAKELFESKAE